MRSGLYGSPTLGDYRGDSDYPVQVEFIIPTGNSRFFAIPLLGYIARGVLLVPHVIVLVLLGFLVSLLQLVLWIPVLFAGRYPKWGYSIVGGYLRWSTRVFAYTFGLTDRYPPFRLGR